MKERIFWGFYRNLFLINHLRQVSSHSDFGFEFADIHNQKTIIRLHPTVLKMAYDICKPYKLNLKNRQNKKKCRYNRNTPGVTTILKSIHHRKLDVHLIQSTAPNVIT
jgi:hypothetical protein